jgi:tripartite-type tricarboxylate transporter receptor subunit TctC
MDPELQAKIRAQGIDPRDIELEKFDLHIQADMARLDPLLKAIADQR